MVLFPDFLLLEVVQLGTIEDLMNLRLVCSRFKAIIQAYQYTICSRLSQEHLETDQVEIFKLYRPQSLDLPGLFQMTRRTKMISRVCEYMYSNCVFSHVMASSPITITEAGAIQARIRKGLAVLWNFAAIAKDIRAKHGIIEPIRTVRIERKPASRVRAWLRKGLAISRRSKKQNYVLPKDDDEGYIEQPQPPYIDAIFRSWGDYITRLAKQHRLDYALIRFFLVKAFDGRWFGFNYHEIIEYSGLSGYNNGDCWSCWFVLTSGPEFLFRSWGFDSKSKPDLTEPYTAWTALSRVEQLWQYRAGRETEALLRSYGDYQAMGVFEIEAISTELRSRRDLFDVEWNFRPQPGFLLGEPRESCPFDELLRWDEAQTALHGRHLLPNID